MGPVGLLCDILTLFQFLTPRLYFANTVTFFFLCHLLPGVDTVL